MARGGELQIWIGQDARLNANLHGAPDEWVCVIRPGRILVEMEGVAPDVAKEAMRLAAMKLPLPTKLVTREFEGA